MGELVGAAEPLREATAALAFLMMFIKNIGIYVRRDLCREGSM